MINFTSVQSRSQEHTRSRLKICVAMSRQQRRSVFPATLFAVKLASHLIQALQKWNLWLIPSKTIICFHFTTILGLAVDRKTSIGQSTSHSHCVAHIVPRSWQSSWFTFISVYKLLGRVSPKCLHIAGLKGEDRYRRSTVLQSRERMHVVDRSVIQTIGFSTNSSNYTQIHYSTKTICQISFGWSLMDQLRIPNTV